MSQNLNLTKEQALYFKNMFRSARAAATDDAEGFQEIAFSIERLGMTLSGKSGALGYYKEFIRMLLTRNITDFDVEEFDKLYKLVQNGRNDALHQGAYARNLVRHCVELSFIIEDALNSIILKDKTNFKVSDFMVPNPTMAKLWQPVNLVRQQLLANSYSYIPILNDEKWFLISESNLVTYLSTDVSNRKSKLAESIDEILKEDCKLNLIEATTCNPSALIESILSEFEKNNGAPVLVLKETELIGLISPFDLL